MAAKIGQENVELLENARIEHENVANVQIEHARNTPMNAIVGPPPPYEEVCGNIDTEAKNGCDSKYGPLIFNTLIYIIALIELLLAIVLILFYLSSLKTLLPSLTIDKGIPILLLTILSSLILFSSNYIHTAKFYNVYMAYIILVAIRCLVALAFILLLSSSLQEIDNSKNELISNITELNKTLEDYEWRLRFVNPIINPPQYMKDLMKDFNMDHKKVFGVSFKEHEKNYNELNERIEITRAKIKGLEKEILAKTEEAKNQRTLLVVFVLLIFLGSLFILIVYQTYKMKKNEKVPTHV